jgi:hypothetical protein
MCVGGYFRIWLSTVHWAACGRCISHEDPAEGFMPCLWVSVWLLYLCFIAFTLTHLLSLSKSHFNSYFSLFQSHALFPFCLSFYLPQCHSVIPPSHRCTYSTPLCIAVYPDRVSPSYGSFLMTDLWLFARELAGCLLWQGAVCVCVKRERERETTCFQHTHTQKHRRGLGKYLFYFDLLVVYYL